MSNANRDYVIVYDVKNSSLVLSRPLNFYITDQNTSNIFVRLVTKVSVGDGIDQYTDIEEASSYALTMRVIKPNNEVKSIEATQHELESIFQFDLTEDFKDIPGKYICELVISTIVSERQELITSDPFNYEVKRSILSNVSEIIETENTTVEKLLNEVDAAKAELSSRIAELSMQIKEIVLQDKLKNRRISYNFSATPWQFSYDGGEHPARPEQITSQLEKMKYLGFDGIVVMATLIDDGNGGIDFNIPLDRYLWYVTETIRLGMSVRAIKIHMNENLFVTVSNIESKYRNKVMQLANATKSYDIPYFVLYNEAVNYLYNADTSRINSITTLCQDVRNLGFKVGISGLSLKKVYELQWLNDCQDVMFPFAYTRIGYKGRNTTVADSLFAHKEEAKVFARYKELIGKPIIISETGISPYWGAFSNPVYFDWNKTESADNSGEIQKIFFYGLFNTPEYNIIDECWVWFPDDMTVGDAYNNCSNFIRSYTQGGN